MDPVTLAIIGGLAGAALDKDDPARGAVLGATAGFGGGTAMGLGGTAAATGASTAAAPTIGTGSAITAESAMATPGAQQAFGQAMGFSPELTAAMTPADPVTAGMTQALGQNTGQAIATGQAPGVLTKSGNYLMNQDAMRRGMGEGLRTLNTTSANAPSWSQRMAKMVPDYFKSQDGKGSQFTKDMGGVAKYGAVASSMGNKGQGSAPAGRVQTSGYSQSPNPYQPLSYGQQVYRNQRYPGRRY